MITYQEQQLADTSYLELRKVFYLSLSAPLDGMWDYMIHQAKQWLIYDDQELVGYFAVDAQQSMLNFYIQPVYLKRASFLFSDACEIANVKDGIVSTNNPVFLLACLDHSHSVQLHSYLFYDSTTQHTQEQLNIVDEKDIHLAKPEDISRVVDFCIQQVPMDKAWLTAYFNRLIKRKELYMLLRREEVLGTFEVRKSDTQPRFADLGVIVNTAHRKQGLGTSLLCHAKQIAYDQGLIPICSCEDENTGSRIMIEKAGFTCKHRILRMGYGFGLEEFSVEEPFAE